MNAFVTYLEKYKPLLADERRLIEELAKVEHLNPGEYFLEAGRYCNKIGFVTEGVLRIMHYDREGNEIVRYFIKEGQFAVDLHAYNNQVTATEYIQTVTHCQLIVFSRKAMETFAREIRDWDRIIKQITDSALLEKLYNRSDLVGQDAKSKYLDFIKKHKDIANRIPLGQIASYLGIKQQSLSRIRKEV